MAAPMPIQAPTPIEAAVTSAVFWRSSRMCWLSCRSRLRPWGGRMGLTGQYEAGLDLGCVKCKILLH